jgi:hypothetical protein
MYGGVAGEAGRPVPLCRLQQKPHFSRKKRARNGAPVRGTLFEHEDVLLRAHFLQHPRPDSDADFAQVGFAQQEHHGAGLADAAADRE